MLTWRHFREIAHNTVLESRGSDGPDLLVLLWVSFGSQKRGPKGLPDLHYRLTLCARHVTPLIRQNKKKRWNKNVRSDKNWKDFNFTHFQLICASDSVLRLIFCALWMAILSSIELMSKIPSHCYRQFYPVSASRLFCKNLSIRIDEHTSSDVLRWPRPNRKT